VEGPRFGEELFEGCGPEPDGGLVHDPRAPGAAGGVGRAGTRGRSLAWRRGRRCGKNLPARLAGARFAALAGARGGGRVSGWRRCRRAEVQLQLPGHRWGQPGRREGLLRPARRAVGRGPSSPTRRGLAPARRDPHVSAGRPGGGVELLAGGTAGGGRWKGGRPSGIVGGAAGVLGAGGREGEQARSDPPGLPAAGLRPGQGGTCWGSVCLRWRGPALPADRPLQEGMLFQTRLADPGRPGPTSTSSCSRWRGPSPGPAGAGRGRLVQQATEVLRTPGMGGTPEPVAAVWAEPCVRAGSAGSWGRARRAFGRRLDAGRGGKRGLDLGRAPG